jgi:uncharacterized membrane protein HdeD (DUF308 family)
MLAILFGIAALVWPGLTLAALVVLFGAYALADGVTSLVTALTDDQGGREPLPTWELVLEGIAGMGVGLLTFLLPGVTAMLLLYLIAGWAILTGLFEIAAAIRLRREIENELLLGLGGVLSILFGVLLVVLPSEGAIAVAWIIGAYAIAFGVVLLALAFRLREFASGARPTAAA